MSVQTCLSLALSKREKQVGNLLLAELRTGKGIFRMHSGAELKLPPGMKPRCDGEGESCRDASGIEDMMCCQSERLLGL